VDRHVDHEDYAIAESTLYEWVQSYLYLRFQEYLKPLLGESLPPICTVTAKANMPGQWVRPDVGLIALWRNKYSTTLQLDVYGFEVKTHQGCDLVAVHEALAQTRVVHYSYLVWHAPEIELGSSHFEEIRGHCDAFGIGLITFSRRKDANTFIRHIRARRAQPEADAVDEFIETAFLDEDRERLLQFLPSLGSHEAHRNS